jgi:ribosomal protein S18 acetylase RimI-like enzyme
MALATIIIRNEVDPALAAFLDDRLYDFNSRTTGILDGELFSDSVRDKDNQVIAGVSGHTWGGCCEIKRLWVDEKQRGRGWGHALMQAAESEARTRGCHQVMLSTHSFQAPVFYERLGYRKQATIENYPIGHSKVYYVKLLEPTESS